MSCLLSTLLSIIIFRLDFSIVILVNNIDVDLVSLLFQEVSGSDHFGQDIPHSENIGLSWALGVQFFFCIGNRSLLFPWSWNQQFASSYPCAQQMLYQCTTLYLYICLLTVSMVIQWWFVFTSSPLTYYCRHNCKSLSL